MTTEIDHLDPAPETVTLESGLEVRIRPLKTLELFALMRIITRGAGPMLARFPIDLRQPNEVLMTQLLGLIVAALPEADQEAIEFVKKMSEPVGLHEGRRLSPDHKAENAELFERFDRELDNPEIEDLITILETVVRREAEDIASLGKRLRALWSLAERTGQEMPPTITSENSNESTQEESSEDSRAFDLISSQYHWTDHEIRELPLGRLRQIVTAIQERQYLDGLSERTLLSWSTRTIAQFVAAAGMNEDLPEQAAVVAFDREEREFLKKKLREPDEPIQEENADGSFERFMLQFAGRL